jgi:hypothetical protein
MWPHCRVTPVDATTSDKLGSHEEHEEESHEEHEEHEDIWK